MKRAIGWITCNAVMAACLWYGLVGGIEGAKNVGLFMVWTSAIVSLGFMSETMQAEFKKKGRAVPSEVTLAFDFVVCGFLIWCGFWFTGAAQFIQMCMYEGAYREAGKAANE